MRTVYTDSISFSPSYFIGAVAVFVWENLRFYWPHGLTHVMRVKQCLGQSQYIFYTCRKY